MPVFKGYDGRLEHGSIRHDWILESQVPRAVNTIWVGIAAALKSVTVSRIVLCALRPNFRH